MREKMNYFTFIVAGIRNKPGRNLAALFCFAFMAANIFSGQFLIAGAAGSLDRGVSRMGADHLVVPSEYTVFLRGGGPVNTLAIIRPEASGYRINAEIMEKLGKIPGISEMSPQLYVSTMDLPDISPAPVELFGIDPATDFTIQPWLQKPLSNPMVRGEVILGNEVGSDRLTDISIGCRTYRIAGRLDPTRSPMDHTVFLHLEDAYTLAATKGMVSPSAPQISPGDVNAVLVRDAPGEDRVLVTNRIKRLFTTSPDYRYFSVIGRHFTLDPVAEEIQAIPGLLNMISVFVVIIALPLIALISAMVAHERQREIGLLKSMGAKRKAIFIVVMAESLVLAIAGGCIGVGASFLMLFVLNTQGILNSTLQVTFLMPPFIEIGKMAGLALLVVITVGSIASLWPAYRCSTLGPYDAIRGEGS